MFYMELILKFHVKQFNTTLIAKRDHYFNNTFICIGSIWDVCNSDSVLYTHIHLLIHFYAQLFFPY
ncbi:MAG: hypothetical protein RLZZ76_79 [Candidatus Parcubacteria bacterium]|jgi:hypothetical protein